MIIPMSVIHKFFGFCFSSLALFAFGRKTITPMSPGMLFTIALKPGPERSLKD